MLLLVLFLFSLITSHPLTELILRPEKKVTDSKEYMQLLVERSKYIEIFAAFGHCYPKDINASKCCPNLLPNKLFTPNSEGWELIDYGTSTASAAEREGVFSNEYNYYAIFRNDIVKKVVITFPGTKNGALQGIKEGIYSYLTKFNLKKYKQDIKLTKYFGLRAYLTMKDLFKAKNLNNMRLDQGYQLILTGHSLGGAMAMGTLLFALDQSFISREQNHPVVVTYGQPRVGNEEFAKLVQREAEVIYRNTNERDPVHQIPLYGIGGVYHTQGRIKIDGDDKVYTIPSNVFEYDVDKLNDKQEYSVFDIVKYLITGLNRHVHYYGVKIDGLCAP